MLSALSLIAVASPSLALDRYTVSYESSWTMSANNVVTFTMQGFDSSLIQIEGGALSQISVNIFLNSLVGSFTTNPGLGVETEAVMSLTTMNSTDPNGFFRVSDPLNGPSGDGTFYTFMSYSANSTAIMAFLPSKTAWGNFVTDTTLTFTLTGTIPAADDIEADYNMAGSGTSVISYSYYGIPAPVPEPSTVTLALAGLVMLFTRRRIHA